MHVLAPLLLLATTAQAHCVFLLEYPSSSRLLTDSPRPLLQDRCRGHSGGQRMDRCPPNQELPDEYRCHLRYQCRYAVLPGPRGYQHSQRSCWFNFGLRSGRERQSFWPSSTLHGESSGWCGHQVGFLGVKPLLSRNHTDFSRYVTFS